MHRVRIRYTKDGRVRFVSARDLTSVWERALRRSGLPITYSEGFSPRPKVSFPDALPVGVASTGEYAELTFDHPMDDLGQAMAQLSAALPQGMQVLAYQVVEDGMPKLARYLEVTLWEVVYPGPDEARVSSGDLSAPGNASPSRGDTDVPTDHVVATLQRLGEALLAADEAPVTRRRPGAANSHPNDDAGADDVRIVDLRPSLIDLTATERVDRVPGPHGPEARDDHPVPTVRAILRNDGPSLRPTDLHDALLTHRTASDPEIADPRYLRRVVQGRLADRGVEEALTGRREALVASTRDVVEVAR